jgi:histidinol dehydrogenase
MIPVFESVEAFLKERSDTLDEIGVLPKQVMDRVESIVEQVRREGDGALVRLSRDIDEVEIDATQLLVPNDVIEESAARTSEQVQSVLKKARLNIQLFHERQKESRWQIEFEDGTVLGQRVVPLSTVGIYVPGGKAPYPSSLLMNGVPAKIAGVGRLVVATPPGTIERCPALAFALQMLGIGEVYRLGGAQAVAALAYGTKTVPKVDKIVGPGNIYVAAAKKLVFGQVGIDSIAGPSEIAVLADESADARYVAADLLSQAEHGSGDERSFLITTSKSLIQCVQKELSRQLAELPRSEEVQKILYENGAAIWVPDIGHGVSLVDRIAPEHLEIICVDAEAVASRIQHAGAVFIGAFSPVPVGDFFAGPNHVLPTGGTARFTSPLGVYDFVKRSSWVRYSRERLAQDRESIETFARVEGFEAHARAISVRFER